MNKPIEPMNKMILFIEDEEEHYEKVAEQLRLHGYQCQRVARAKSELIELKALELKPVAAVVDFVLSTTSPKVLDKVAEAHLAEAHLGHKPAQTVEEESIAEEHYGVEIIPILRRVCPSIKILVYTQYAKRSELPSQVKLYGADAGVPKQRDQEGKLLVRNAREIAAKVRELIE